MQYNYYFSTNFKWYINFLKNEITILLFHRCLEIPVVAETLEPGDSQSGKFQCFSWSFICSLTLSCSWAMSGSVLSARDKGMSNLDKMLSSWNLYPCENPQNLTSIQKGISRQAYCTWRQGQQRDGCIRTVWPIRCVTFSSALKCRTWIKFFSKEYWLLSRKIRLPTLICATRWHKSAFVCPMNWWFGKVQNEPLSMKNVSSTWVTGWHGHSVPWTLCFKYHPRGTPWCLVFNLTLCSVLLTCFQFDTLLCSFSLEDNMKLLSEEVKVGFSNGGIY